MSGREWIVEAYGCDPGALANLGKLRRLFDAMVDELALRPVGEALWRQFPAPGGITGLLLLAESHLACHTFPEHRSLCLNLFCCRPRPEWDFDGRLRRVFGATRVNVRVLERPFLDRAEGAEAASAATEERPRRSAKWLRPAKNPAAGRTDAHSPLGASVGK